MILFLAFIALALAVMFQSTSMPDAVLEPLGPAAFPFWLGITLLVLSGLGLFEHLRDTRSRRGTAEASNEAIPDKAAAVTGLVAVSLMTVAYSVCVQFGLISFWLATGAYLFGIMAYFSEKKPAAIAALLVVSLILGVAIEYLFTEIFFIDIAG